MKRGLLLAISALALTATSQQLFAAELETAAPQERADPRRNASAHPRGSGNYNAHQSSGRRLRLLRQAALLARRPEASAEGMRAEEVLLIPGIAVQLVLAMGWATAR